jgi:hypothetical protein
MSLDTLMAERYDSERNNCVDFAAKAWAHITGDAQLLNLRESDRAGLRGIMRTYTKVEGPTAFPSLSLMEDMEGRYHMGVCVRGRLFHLTDDGVMLLPFDVVKNLYRNLRFYR